MPAPTGINSTRLYGRFRVFRRDVCREIGCSKMLAICCIQSFERSIFFYLLLCTWLQSFSPHQSQSHIHFTIYLQPTCKSKKVISRFLYFTLHTSSPIDTTTTPILYTLAPAHNSRTRERKLPLLICCLLDTSEPRVLQCKTLVDLVEWLFLC